MDCVVEEMFEPVEGKQVKIIHPSALHAHVREGRAEQELVIMAFPALLKHSNLVMRLLCGLDILFTLCVMGFQIRVPLLLRGVIATAWTVDWCERTSQLDTH